MVGRSGPFSIVYKQGAQEPSVALGARAAVPSPALCFGREMLPKDPSVGCRGPLRTRCIAGPQLTRGCVPPSSTQPRVVGAGSGPVAPSLALDLREPRWETTAKAIKMFSEET